MSRGECSKTGAGGILHYVQGGHDACCTHWPGRHREGGQREPQPPPAQQLPTGTSGQGSPGIMAAPRWGAQAGHLAMFTPPCSSVPPPCAGVMGGGDPLWPPGLAVCSPRSRQWSLLSGSTPLPWHRGPSLAHPGGCLGLWRRSGAERWAQCVPGGAWVGPCCGLDPEGDGAWRIGHRRVFGEQFPHASTVTHCGTWRSRGCPSWRGWCRQPVGTPGAGSASPPTAGQKEGLSTGVRLVAPQGAGGPQVPT